VTGREVVLLVVWVVTVVTVLLAVWFR